MFHVLALHLSGLRNCLETRNLVVTFVEFVVSQL